MTAAGFVDARSLTAYAGVATDPQGGGAVGQGGRSRGTYSETNMHLVVFGANGPTGRLIVQQALTAGHHVTAVTRKPNEFPQSSPHLAVAAADVTDPDGVERALAGSQAVISTYGV